MAREYSSLGLPECAGMNGVLLERLNSQPFLIAAHRGQAGGTIVENTSAAINACFNLGADIAEIDLMRSADGVFYLFHPGYEKMHFDLNVDITTLTSEEIDSLQYAWFVSESNRPCTPVRLSDVLEKVGDGLLNLDKAWLYGAELLDFLAAHRAHRNCILKGPAHAENFDLMSSHDEKFMFMPIVETASELEAALAAADSETINMVGIELLTDGSEDTLSSQETLDRIRSKGLYLWLNAINVAEGTPMFLGWDDETSVLHDPAMGWGRLIDAGANVIQTDFTPALASYRAS
ncbi:glycerophosphodiester phosphodiesterase family protein [Corynebacterium timonense]|uniref:Glycerophosphoryl diester phosphodiesterase n=1 Tax=Corynebacterium timonense TaxID=441500 RepID=A0A1H1SB57_9CORY|nr:glycerophosphodiester phosphodiesterase family protein [Corynebacterium timonense]SDS45194.1 glycerophosphoryl diester phosphodiesterase [Corynebacterium timonense]